MADGRVVPRIDKPETSRFPLLAERESTHGPYWNTSAIAQHIKEQFHKTSGWLKLAPWHRESLDMIATKIARILNGDPNNIDSWQDIAGYATLVVEILKEKGT